MSDAELPDDVGAEIVAPQPAALIETFRAIGYNLPSAIADIVDNSIAAGAGNVWIDFSWAEENSSVTIRDDGQGMTEKQLIEALRPGTSNPLQERGRNDLGRFGLGLKTASFSQCRRLNVITKSRQEGIINFRGWDLDYVEKNDVWRIFRYCNDEELLGTLNKQTSGTVVVWTIIDRIIFNQHKHIITPAKFWDIVKDVEEHLAVIFHRFIEKKSLAIWLNNRQITAINPFMPDHPATQIFPDETFENGLVTIQGFVLPHAGKLSSERWSANGGSKGWTAQQGFYVYRKDRILVAGDWLGVFRKDEHTRLARIMIEIDATLDFSWQLDIRKSRAIPPRMFQQHLKRYGAEIRKRATEVFRHRGKQQKQKTSRNDFEFAWIVSEDNGRETFTINRQHPLVKALYEHSGEIRKSTDDLLKLLEITLPVPSLILNETLKGEYSSGSMPAVKESEVVRLMQAVYQKLRANGTTHDKALEDLYFIDPFSNYPHLIEQIR
ncbi:ATP-binding protein [Mucilaginibacter sp. dw_454]|uniref:ATP-binding protein n=1 Tax=Mucilaginibacter sp. dw_454 TaxID=2720079 RepID=UPI001BD35A54|nr:ATP-binding protein [Mucilaginibacter sp. dw_454]